jgi:hypothetical protein
VYTDSFGNFNSSYTVSTLSPSTGSNIRCDSTHQCALWVGVDYNSDFNGSATHAFSSNFVMTAAGSFTSANHATFPEGVFGSFSIGATGNPSPTISESGALPSGVSFNGGVGTASLSGVPSVAGSFPITLTATNGIGSPTNQSFTLTVAPAGTFAIVLSTPPPATLGQPYSFQMQAVGPSTPPDKWKTTKLPKGLKLNKASGLISGTPSTKNKTGAFPFTATVKDHTKHAHMTATANFTLQLQ